MLEVRLVRILELASGEDEGASDGVVLALVHGDRRDDVGNRQALEGFGGDSKIGDGWHASDLGAMTRWTVHSESEERHVADIWKDASAEASVISGSPALPVSVRPNWIVTSSGRLSLSA